VTEEKQSEAQLCAAFRAWCEALGWIVHPEVSTYDLVLTRAGVSIEQALRTERPLGLDAVAVTPYWIPGKADQIGVQAKLTANVDVLYQAVRDQRVGPTWRLVLVPSASSSFIGLAEHLGVMVAVQEDRRELGGFARGRVKRVPVDDGFRVHGRARSVPVTKQLELPPVVTNLVAGGPSPSALTPWRVKALRLCRILRAQGYVTTADFKSVGIDKRVWLDRGWLTVGSERVMVAGHNQSLAKMLPGSGLPDVGWEQISAELAKKETP
jgi:hypothetical protein